MPNVSDAGGAARTSVLFVGNSYTYFNDMPAIFAAICAENGVDAEVDSVAGGDYSLGRFLDGADELGAQLAEKLAGGKWDYVVLQEYSTLPATDPDVLCKSAAHCVRRTEAAGAKPVFYETWGRGEGSEVLAEIGMTCEELQSKLTAAYEKAAQDGGAILVRAGERFYEAYRAGEAVYLEDMSHPTELGSTVVAKEFYRTLFE